MSFSKSSSVPPLPMSHVEAAVALMTMHLKQASDEAAEYLKDHFE
ncbi:hypothetical protein [Pseudomonas fluorescens]|nr:hypothetical protein [Pseudomonas fluorescens]